VKNSAPLVSVQDLHLHFTLGAAGLSRTKAVVKALDGVDIDIARGETLGVVGESGCGKSTLGRCIVGLLKPTAGRILYDGQDVGSLNHRQTRPLRKRLQIVFQDPYASLNPRMTSGDIIAEPLRVHKVVEGRFVTKRVQELMTLVGLDPRFIRRYPHEFSGGQRQRIAIARALALEPEFIVADEPISALDVSVQAQILNLMISLQDRLGLTCLFISHDLSAVRHISSRIAVMYLGRIVELASPPDLYSSPRHPYSAALIAAAPIPDPRAHARRRIVLKGDVPSPLNPPGGCRFHTRCPIAEERCRREEPELREAAPERYAACHFAERMPEAVGVTR
jgi:oligopeptide transport system ATP-binding protein